MRPRNLDGSFNGKRFTEANSAIYTHAIPEDMPGLIRLFGGREQYVAALNQQFELAQAGKFHRAAR